MPRRSSHRVRAPQDFTASQEIERLLATRRFKDAVKQAKLLFQREDTPAHRVLLERAYVLRVEQLLQGDMRASAVEVAGQVLDLGVTDEAVLKDFILLLLSLGMEGPAFALSQRIDAPEFQQALTAKVADLAVLHPGRNPTLPADVRSGAAAVRTALDALDAGNDDVAFEQFRDIPRSSPFADWRLFVRGLAALRRGDVPQMTANWDRLDSARAASRIAGRLRNPQLPPADPDGPAVNSSSQAVLESRVFGEPVLARLRQLDELVQLGHWNEALKMLGSLRGTLRRIDVPLAQRLTDVLLHPLADAYRGRSESARRQLLADFFRVAEPPPLDPNWNRVQAILCETETDDLERAIRFWRMFVADLETVAHLSAEERRTMQAVVVRHFAEIYAFLSTPPESPFNLSPFGPPGNRGHSPELRAKAIDAVEASLRFDSTRKAGFDLLFRFHQAWEQPEAAAAAARRLLAAFPDDFDRLLHLAEYHVRRDEPDQALPLIEEARRLKPLEPMAASHERSIRLGVARHHALAGRWDAGRSELARVQAAWPEQQSRRLLQGRIAAFECKAGQPTHWDQLLNEGTTPPEHNPSFYLALAIDAIRYQLPAPARDRAFRALQDALAEKFRGETAAGFCTTLTPYLQSAIDYPGRDRHVRDVVAYLRRGARAKYRHDDLISVCQFLQLAPEAGDLFAKSVRRGIKLFPDSAYFLTFDAHLEIEKGPFRGDARRAQRQLEQALELLQRTEAPRQDNLEEIIKQNLSLVRNLTGGPMGAFVGGGMPGGLPPAAASILEDLFSLGAEEGEFPDGDIFDDFFGKGGKPRSRRRSR